MENNTCSQCIVCRKKIDGLCVKSANQQIQVLPENKVSCNYQQCQYNDNSGNCTFGIKIETCPRLKKDQL